MTTDPVGQRPSNPLLDAMNRVTEEARVEIKKAVEASSTEKPLPCPFCGSETLYDKHGHNASGGELHWVKCGNCHARGPSLEVWGTAVEAWNDRVAT